MIISKKYAQHLIRTGRAIERMPIRDDHNMYWSIDRLDLQRVDHVRSPRSGTFWNSLPALTKLGRAPIGA
jgi:hypothetical protein